MKEHIHDIDSGRAQSVHACVVVQRRIALVRSDKVDAELLEVDQITLTPCGIGEVVCDCEWYE
jgi:hypothetical protein